MINDESFDGVYWWVNLFDDADNLLISYLTKYNLWIIWLSVICELFKDVHYWVHAYSFKEEGLCPGALCSKVKRAHALEPIYAQ